jgi:mRNA-degrading endonuclease RelE of RelBE toxin-antitoxin system
MVYTLQIDNAAFRLFRKLPKRVQKQFLKKAQELKTNPLKAQTLKGEYRFLHSLHFSFRGTAYRLIYQVLPRTSTVIVRLAASRENIYRRLKQMKIKPLKEKDR